MVADEYFLSLVDAHKNPFEWSTHSQSVAYIAETIAKKCGMDSDMAYAAGLLHDVGKFDGLDTGLTHPVRGYRILMDKPEFSQIAHVCLTHTFYGFYEVNFDNLWVQMQKRDVKIIKNYMKSHEMEDLDLLIQLADNMSNSARIMTISDRFCDILLRHRTNTPGKKLEVLFSIKQYFDAKANMNIYDLFRDEIIKTAMMEPNPWVAIPVGSVNIRGKSRKLPKNPIMKATSAILKKRV